MSLFWIIVLVWLAPAMLFGACLLWIFARAPKGDYKIMANEIPPVPAAPEAIGATVPSAESVIQDNEGDSRPARSQLAG